MMLYPKNRLEWLDLRRRYVSSTESAALFGLSKYQTAFELGVSKRVGLDTFEENERSEWGKELERTIARMFCERHGLKFRAMTGYADAGDGMGASFDFEIVGADDAPATEIGALYHEHGAGVLEIKNVDTWIYRNEWTDEAPAHIEIQLQHQLEACEREWACLAVLVGGNRLESFLRRRDREVGASLRRRIGAFWTDFHRGTLPPPVLPADAALIAQLYKHSEPGSVLDAQGNATITDLCMMYAVASTEERAAKQRKDSAKASLLQLIGTHERVLADGYTISAGTVGEAEIAAYTRSAYRNFKVTPKKSINGKDRA
jgi:putative phage-type endonuclease